MAKRKDNYLDYIPVRVDKFKWETKDGIVTIFVENKGFFNFLAQKLLHKPKVSQVHLEEIGSFVWPLIDGEKSIYEIGKYVEEHFGDKCEPLYERLSRYFQMLVNCGFVKLNKGDSMK